MKFHFEKFNNFFTSDFDKDVKDFVIEIFNALLKDTDNNIDIFKSKILFLSLGFYEIEKSDDDALNSYEDDELDVIDFYKFSRINPDFKKLLLSIIQVQLTTSDDGNDSEFFDDFIRNDLKVIVKFQDWNKINRKNKLKKLNEL